MLLRVSLAVWLALLHGVALSQPQQATSRVHIAELARRIHHPANLRALDTFRQQIADPIRPVLVKDPDGKTHWDCMPSGREPCVAVSTSRLGQQLRIELEKTPWTYDSLVGRRPTAREPWSQPRPAEEPLEHLRAALINSLGRWADAKGYVDLDRVRTDLGRGPSPLGSLVEVLRTREVSRDVRVTSHQLLGHLREPVRDQILAAHHLDVVPRYMPALRWISRRYPDEHKELASKTLLGEQHLVRNTAGLLAAMELQPARVELWGKPYSLEAMVTFDMLKRGYVISAEDFHHDRPRFEQRLRERLRAIDPAQAVPRSIMLLDDGGELIEAVAQIVRKEFPAHARLFAAVEQTTKGRNLIKDQEVPFPVVDVAGSWAKRRWAARMHGFAIAKETQRLVDRYYDHSGWRPKTAVVLGFGAIGRNVARSLRRLEDRRAVVVWDTDPAARRAAAADGFTVADSREAALASAEVLISCTGQSNAVSNEDLLRLPRQAILVNGASRQEFSLSQAPMLAYQSQPKFLGDFFMLSFNDISGRFDTDHVFYNICDRRNPPLPGQKLCLTTTLAPFDKPKNAQLKPPDKILLVAKGDGVVNFPQSLTDCHGGSTIPERFIQLDLGLLYLGLLQAQQTEAKGLVKLDDRRQRELVSFVEAKLRRRGETLRTPFW